MQLTFLKLGLPFVVVATLVSGQQGKPASTQQPTQQSAAKQSSAAGVQAKAAHETKVHHRVVRKRNAKASHRNGAKRAPYRPEYSEHSVQVINGTSTKQVVFNEEKKPVGADKGESAQMKVEVVNGTSSDTQYFYAGNGQGEQNEAVSKRPVVVGIQSSDTRAVGGSKHPVVTGITAAEPGDAKSVNSGGQKVTTGVAPQPKRPEYQPETH
ncbi:MAG TPA: hypothetical protein VK574_11135 [Terracidiphilus sp.]|nr:hypothetical protein [Terracidiphilus sp.]